MNKKNALISLLVFAVLIGGGFTYLQHTETSKAEKTETVSVTRGSLQERVSAQGKLEPKDYVDVGVQVSGQVKKLYVEIGDVVKQGDLLAELDPLPYESRVAADEAGLNSLKAQVLQKKAEAELAQSQFSRAEKMAKVKAISDDDMESKTSALKVANATVQSLEAQVVESEANLQSDKINLGYTKIYAPMNGIISNQIAREGQTLNANQTTPTLVQIADLNTMTVRAQVAEADVMRLKTDMDVTFAPLGALDRKWKGRVRQILPTPQSVNDVVLYDALIDTPNEDRQLMNGMSVQVFFEIAHADDVLLLPTKALGSRLEANDNDTGKAYRVTLKGGAIEESRIVYVGMTTRTQVEIREGIQLGDQVIVKDKTLETEKSDRTPGTTGKAAKPPGMGPHL